MITVLLKTDPFLLKVTSSSKPPLWKYTYSTKSVSRITIITNKIKTGFPCTWRLPMNVGLLFHSVLLPDQYMILSLKSFPGAYNVYVCFKKKR